MVPCRNALWGTQRTRHTTGDNKNNVEVSQRGSAPKRKAPQTQDDKLCHKRQYDATDRQRTFQLTWLQQFVWLDYRPRQTGDAPKSSQNPSTSAATSDGTVADDRMRMFCKTCIKYEKVGSFVVGSTVFKLESIKAHNVSSGPVKWIQKEEGSKQNQVQGR